jgi:hypothetical protein
MISVGYFIYVNKGDNMVGKGSIVKYQDGFYRVTRSTKNTVNLGPVFGGKVYYKGVQKTEVVEAYDEWHDYWSKSETYRCM